MVDGHALVLRGWYVWIFAMNAQGDQSEELGGVVSSQASTSSMYLMKRGSVRRGLNAFQDKRNSTDSLLKARTAWGQSDKMRELAAVGSTVSLRKERAFVINSSKNANAVS